MPDVRENIVEKLTEMLDLAKAGKMTHLAYHHNNGSRESWGFLNLSEHGRLLVPARLSALAIEDETEADE